MSTSGKGLAKLIALRSNHVLPLAGSNFVELLDEFLRRDHPERRVDELPHFAPVHLLPCGEVQAQPAGRAHVRREEEAAVLFKSLAVAVVDLDQDRVGVRDVFALYVGRPAGRSGATGGYL